MAVKTTLEQLEEVQAAITEVMTSQSLSGSGGNIVRANLKDLVALREKLEAKYNREQGQGGLTINIGIPRRDY